MACVGDEGSGAVMGQYIILWNPWENFDVRGKTFRNMPFNENIYIYFEGLGNYPSTLIFFSVSVDNNSEKRKLLG